MKSIITLTTLIISLMLITGCASKNKGLIKSPCACDFTLVTVQPHG